LHAHAGEGGRLSRDLLESQSCTNLESKIWTISSSLCWLSSILGWGTQRLDTCVEVMVNPAEACAGNMEDLELLASKIGPNALWQWRL